MAAARTVASNSSGCNERQNFVLFANAISYLGRALSLVRAPGFYRVAFERRKAPVYFPRAKALPNSSSEQRAWLTLSALTRMFLLHDAPSVFVGSQAGELRMPQMIRLGPF